MRRLILFALIVFPVCGRAQHARPFAERGDVALVVGISPADFPSVTSALGGVGLRYRVNDLTVLGASVGFGASTLNRDDSGDGRGAGSGRVSVWNENHIGRRRGVVSPFFGGGFTAGFSRETFTRDDVPCDPAACPDGPQTVESRRTHTSFGVGAILGAEVHVARGVTLGAAYTLGVGVERFVYTTDDPFSGTPADRSTLVAGGTGLTDLQLSVYF